MVLDSNLSLDRSLHRRDARRSRSEIISEARLSATSIVLAWFALGSLPSLPLARWGRARIAAQWPNVTKPKARLIGAIVCFLSSFLYFTFSTIQLVTYQLENPGIHVSGMAYLSLFLIGPIANAIAGLIGFVLGPVIASIPRTALSLLKFAHTKRRTLFAYVVALIALLSAFYFFADFALFRWYRHFAERGSADAQYNVGKMYWQGAGVSKNEVEAVKWIKSASEKGNLNAQSDLGIIYFNGFGGLDRDYDEAVKWFRLAAEKGHPQAQSDLGHSYAEGLGALDPNQTEAVRWWKMAAVQGHAEAQANLGLRYFNGEGIATDQVRGLMWIALAEKQGHEGAKELKEKVVIPSLTGEQISTAQQMAQHCKVANYKDCE